MKNYFKFLRRRNYNFEWPTRRNITYQRLPITDSDRRNRNLYYEPIKTGCFYVYFPKEFGIESNWVKFVSDIHGSYETVNGVLNTNPRNWCPITLIFNEPDGYHLNHVMFQMSQNLDQYKNFHICIERLNLLGLELDTICINVSHINMINSVNMFSTQDDSLSIEMGLTINNVFIL